MLRKLNRVLSKLVKVATSLKKQSNLQVAEDVATEQMYISLRTLMFAGVFILRTK